MKGTKRFALGILLALIMCAGTVSYASAAEVIVRNTLDNKVNISLVYFDRATGLWTTQGWWAVDGRKSRTITINNVDTSKGVFYAGTVGSTAYVDKSTLNNRTTRKWVSGDAYKFDSPSNNKPSGKNVRQVTFYECKFSKDAGAFIVRIDNKPVG